MSRSVIGGKLLGLTLLSLSLFACMGEDTDVEESTDDATEELAASEIGEVETGVPAVAEEFGSSSSGDIDEAAPFIVPGSDRLEPEPIPWVPHSKPTDPDPKAQPAPLPT